LENINGEPRYCAVILKKGFSSPEIVPLCKETELMDIDSDSLYCSDVLYSLIWKPLETQLKGVKNIYFSADRELHKIGIEYAQMQDEKRMDECYNLYRLSSTRVLAENHKSAKHKDAVLFGGLLYDLKPEQLIAESRKGDYHSKKVSRVRDLSELRYGVKYLPGTKDEVENIYKSFLSNGKANCSIISDIEGTEESFKSLSSKNVGIIHLATHGFYWSEEDAEERNYVSFLSNTKNKSQNYEDMALLRSGLFFSGANIGLAGEELPNDVEDGVLTAKELSAMNLGNVDMVVMSACQSGLGETTGEGVFGLQRGFKLAGANTLLMSLWKVDDEATKILMTEFYKNYLSGKTKRESLKLAQQTLRTTHPEPEYWASFILLDALN
jgi:CHAT domain-containing protein